MALPPLPVDPFIPEIVARLREDRALVVTAAPGAGKTTRVPPALAEDGPALVLQPRRIAARSLARRIAEERGWTIGHEVGWHVRFERQFGPSTRVLLATEGILTARLQDDPLLSDFRTIVLDEFHERSVHADLGLALARQAWRARDDLRIVVMSATLDSQAVSAFLDGCPVVDVPGLAHPLEIRYAADASLTQAMHAAAASTGGQILVFLPGAAEIRRAASELAPAAAVLDVGLVTLHGSMDPAEQDAALAPSQGRRAILATNIAETSLTVPGVRAVIDTGLQKVARYDPDRAIDSLETERVSSDSADQRAGRASRLGPGLAIRLWNGRDRLRPHREPDIARIDLSGPCLEILAWGGNPAAFEWFEPPSGEGIARALHLLERLGAFSGGALTPLGGRMARLPLHPRLSRILLDAGGAWDVALACAALAERHLPPVRARAATSCDLLEVIEHDVPPHVTRVARTLQVLVAASRAPAAGERGLRRAIFSGYADRVGRRRAPGSDRVLLASGHGGVIGAESGVTSGDFIAAIDVTAGRRGDLTEARVRSASVVDREWLEPDASSVDHELGADGVVRATEREYYGSIVLAERPHAVDPDKTAALLGPAFLARGLTSRDAQLVRRMRFAGFEVDLNALVARAAYGHSSIDDIDIERHLSQPERSRLVDLAPTSWTAPSGRRVTLDYLEDGTVTAAVKLQELFGLADTPRVGARNEAVVLALLAPNGRPVQVTRDLRSFWERTYPVVRKELRGRYPKHPWPEDPWTAPPTARTARRVP